MDNEKKFLPKIGALWSRTSKDGNTRYYTGVLHDISGDIPVVIFANTKRDNDKQPNYIVYRQAPQQEEKVINYNTNTEVKKSSHGGFEYPEGDINPDSIPF